VYNSTTVQQPSNNKMYTIKLQPPLQWVPGLFPDGKARKAWRWPAP